MNIFLKQYTNAISINVEVKKNIQWFKFVV